jgi:hypothetical protein
VPIAGKRVKIFKKHTDKEPYVGNADDKEQSDEDHDNVESEESELPLTVDIKEESGSPTDEDGDYA